MRQNLILYPVHDINGGYMGIEAFWELCEQVKLFTFRWPKSENGPAHIVLSDFNFEDHSIDFCIDLIDNERHKYPNHTDEELSETRRFLEAIKTIPEDIRTEDDSEEN